MPSTTTLTAQPRAEIGKIVDRLRRNKSLPAVVYGHNVPSRPLTVEANAFDAVLKTAGTSSLVDLVVADAAPVKVLIHSVQRHPTTGRATHADFYQVQMTEKLEAEIELNFIGESAAVKEQGGVFVRTIDKVKVTCLPSDLVSAIDVDISTLKTFEDRIHVSDIVLPNGIALLEKPEEVVASVAAPRSEDEIASLDAKVEADVDAVEVVKKAEKPDEDAEESAPADAKAEKAPDSKKAEK